MTMLDLTCPKCGGMMELSADKTKCTCPYCDNEVLVDHEQQSIQYRETISPDMQSLEENGIPIRPHIVLQPRKLENLVLARFQW